MCTHIHREEKGKLKFRIVILICTSIGNNMQNL